MVTDSKQVGLSISKTADLLEFSCTTISRIYRECLKNRKINSCEWQFCGWKFIFDERGWRKMAGLVQADKKAILAWINTLYNGGIEENLWTHNMSTIKADGLRQQKTTPGITLAI